MDRNLGATIDKAIIENTAADSLAACGLMYQWGRKDPFPGDHDFRRSNSTDYNYFESKPIYDTSGTLLTEGSATGGTGIRSVKTDTDLTRTGLAKSILEPMTVLLGAEGYSDWYCSSKPAEIKNATRCGAAHGAKRHSIPAPRGGESQRTRMTSSSGTGSKTPQPTTRHWEYSPMPDSAIGQAVAV